MTIIDASDLREVLGGRRVSKRELKMSTPTLGWFAKATLAATHTDPDVGPLHHVRLVADGLTGYGLASDTYRVHQANIGLREDVEHVDVVIPRTALEWAVKNWRAFRPKKDTLITPIAVIEVRQAVEPDHQGRHPGTVQVILREWDEDDAPTARFEAPLCLEPFPNVARVIDDARMLNPGPPAPLNLAHIAAAGLLATEFSDTPVIEFTHRDNGKPGPALLDFIERDVIAATALIQPQQLGSDE